MCAYQRITEILAAAGMPLDQVVVSGASAGGHRFSGGHAQQ